MIAPPLALWYDMVNRKVPKLKRVATTAAGSFLSAKDRMLVGLVGWDWPLVGSLGNICSVNHFPK